MRKDQLRRVRPGVDHDVKVVAHAEDEEDGLERRGESDVRDELGGADALQEGPFAACFGGEGVEFADIVDEDDGVYGGGDGVVGKGGGEGGGGGEADGAGGDGANDAAEASYVRFVLLFSDGNVS